MIPFVVPVVNNSATAGEIGPLGALAFCALIYLLSGMVTSMLVMSIHDHFDCEDGKMFFAIAIVWPVILLIELFRGAFSIINAFRALYGKEENRR